MKPINGERKKKREREGKKENRFNRERLLPRQKGMDTGTEADWPSARGRELRACHGEKFHSELAETRCRAARLPAQNAEELEGPLHAVEIELVPEGEGSQQAAGKREGGRVTLEPAWQCCQSPPSAVFSATSSSSEVEKADGCIRKWLGFDKCYDLGVVYTSLEASGVDI